MKKKVLASLLVGSAVVGASLAPLSAQAVTTGNTPVTVGFEGGSLPDGNGDPNTVRPDPDATNKADEGRNGKMESVGVGDIRGTKEGWHVTTQSTGMKLGEENLEGSITTGKNVLYPLIYDEETKTYVFQNPVLADPVTKPEMDETPFSFSIPLGGDAVLLANATAGRGQGLWQFSMFVTSLNITTPAYNIKAGNYTGNVTWNLVAGPSI